MLKKSEIHIPTPEEDAAINAGIASDPDTFELNETWFAKSKLAEEALPAHLYEGLKKAKVRGKQRTPVKERISIRLSQDVLDRFRATGEGWQTRIDTALKDWLETHFPA